MDRQHRFVRTAVIPVALLMLFLEGCAMRPSVAEVSAPAPKGEGGAGTITAEKPSEAPQVSLVAPGTGEITTHAYPVHSEAYSRS